MVNFGYHFSYLKILRKSHNRFGCVSLVSSPDLGSKSRGIAELTGAIYYTTLAYNKYMFEYYSQTKLFQLMEYNYN